MFLLHLRSSSQNDVVMQLFTFHYVSITSLLPFRPESRRLHLHSTMFLLHPPYSRYEIYLGTNLHSTMFLLHRHVEEWARSHGNIFTFHYVSITSPDGRFEAWIPEQIYIPLCFYYIEQKIMIVDFDVHIYIPLCFYYIHSCNLINFRINPIYIPLCFYYIDLCTYILNYTFTIYYYGY